jgi:hypothetical protein
MIRRRLRLLPALAFVMMIAGFSCSPGDETGPGDSGPVVTDLWIEGPLWTLRDGTAQLEAYAEIDNGVEREVTDQAAWAMQDTSRATVEKGLVTAKDELGPSDVGVVYGGVRFVDPFWVIRSIPGIPAIHLEDTELGVIQFDHAGETKQLVATTRLPDGTDMDVTDRARWSVSNPAAISVTETGLATAHVEQGASEVGVVWRKRRGGAVLQVGDPLPEEYEVTVEVDYLYAHYSCDLSTNLDGSDGEFSYQINVILSDGTRTTVDGTAEYPDPEEVVLIDQGDVLGLDASTTFTANDYQSFEVEFRVTEWDKEFVDFGQYVPDSVMDDRTGTVTHRGSSLFNPGQHSIRLEGSSLDCVVELEYSVAIHQL